MTSVLRRYAQMDPRTQYFVVLSPYTVIGYLNTSTSIPTSSLMTLADASVALAGQTPYPTGTLLKDLGRQITVYDPTVPGSPHVATFRQVMLVNGQNVEGIPTLNPPAPPATSYSPLNSFTYICTWIDITPPGIHLPYILAEVARTG